jgi:type IV fimbrial biogenesis protein FimT
VLAIRHRQEGVTLIELLVGIAILAILLSQAMPSFTAWIQNQQIRNGAEAILNGLQLAKAKAVQSNINTELALIPAATDPTCANVAAATSTTGSNWIVRTFQASGAYQCNPPAPTPSDFIQGRSGEEGSRNATIVADQGSFVFTPLGRLLNPPAADVKIRVDSASSYTDKRRMCVIVTTAGQILMCDPNRVDPTNPQFCPANSCPP